MRDIILGAVLLSVPAVVFALYGVRGPDGEGLGAPRLGAMPTPAAEYARACARCHGPRGEGTHSAPSLLTPRVRALDDAALTRLLRSCAEADCRGPHDYASLGERSVARIIRHLRHLQDDAAAH